MSWLDKAEQKLFKYDLFAVQIPGFNFNGKKSMGTWLGLICSAVGFLCIISMCVTLFVGN